MAGTGGKKILLVDYEVSKMKATEDFLLQAGFEVVKAFDGLDALEKFAEEQPELVLLSAMLPKLHGFEVCKAIKQSDLGKKTPVLITTSVYKSYKYKRQAMKDYMADDYILKPFNYEELLIKIREHLGLSEAEEESASQTKPMEPVKPAPPKSSGGSEKIKEGSGRSFEKLLDETLETLLRTSEMEEVPEDSRPEKVDRDLDSILEDTLSGLLKVPTKSSSTSTSSKSKTAEPAVKAPKEEAPSAEPVILPPPEPEFLPEPEPEVLAPPPPPDSAEDVQEIDRIIDEAIQIIDDAEQKALKPKPEPPPVEEKTVQLSKTEVDDALLKVEEPVVEQEEGVRFGKYLLIEKIATGGMAELWKAKQRGPEGFEKLVALKRILPHLGENEDFITMFIDEGKVAAQLTHPNIAQIYELGEIDESYYIAMEYIAGKDLRTILRVGRRQNKPLTIELAVEIAIKLLSGLHYAHRKKGFNNEYLNIVHRDVSPQNILVSYEGEVKLVDFGIAKAAAKNSVTQTGALKGKILYMSPEQAWGQPVDRRSDIFSVGVLLYEMLTGKRVFLADNEIAILQKVREWEPPPPSSANARISSLLDKIALKAVKKNPGDRFQTAEEMKLELDSFLSAQKPSRRSLDLGLYMRTLFADDIAREAPEILELMKDQEPFEFETAPEPAREEAQVVEPPPRQAVIEEPPPPEPVTPPPVPEPETAPPVVSEEPVEEKRHEPAVVKPELFEPEKVVPEVVEAELSEHVKDTGIPVEPEIEAPPREIPKIAEVVEPPVVEEPAVQDIHRPGPKSAKGRAAKTGKKAKPAVTKVESQEKPPEPVVEKPPKPEPPVQPEPVKTTAFDDDFLKPPQKEPIYKKPIFLGGVGVGLIIILFLIFGGGGDKQAVVPEATPTPTIVEETPTAMGAVDEQTPTPEVTDTATPVPTKTPRGAQTTAAAGTSTPSPIPVTDTPLPTEVETTTPSPAPPTHTAEPTKIPAGTYIEHPDVKPEVVSQEYPQMPAAARQMGVEGNVILKVLVSETGGVLDVSVLQANDQMQKSGCVKAATDAVKTWKFKPATHQGVPVKTHLSLLIPFLKKGPPKSVARPIL